MKQGIAMMTVPLAQLRDFFSLSSSVPPDHRDTVSLEVPMIIRALLLAILVVFALELGISSATIAQAEPAPTPTPLAEPGMDTKAVTTKKKLPKTKKLPLPAVPAGPTPFDPGNAPTQNP